MVVGFPFVMLVAMKLSSCNGVEGVMLGRERRWYAVPFSVCLQWLLYRRGGEERESGASQLVC